MAGTNAHRCEARSKATGQQCKRLTTWRAKNGRWLCPMHGRNDSNPGGPPEGSANAEKTGEHSQKALTRAEEFVKDCASAPVDPTTMLQEQARRTQGRLKFMMRLLLQTEQRLEELAAGGDTTALTALAVVEIARKQEPRTVGDGDKTRVEMTEVELSEKSRSLLDTWIAQHDAITRVELLYGKTAERLKPKDSVIPGTGGIGTLIVNAGIPGVDYPAPDDGGQR